MSIPLIDPYMGVLSDFLFKDQNQNTANKVCNTPSVLYSESVSFNRILNFTRIRIVGSLYQVLQCFISLLMRYLRKYPTILLFLQSYDGVMQFWTLGAMPKEIIGVMPMGSSRDDWSLAAVSFLLFFFSLFVAKGLTAVSSYYILILSCRCFYLFKQNPCLQKSPNIPINLANLQPTEKMLNLLDLLFTSP